MFGQKLSILICVLSGLLCDLCLVPMATTWGQETTSKPGARPSTEFTVRVRKKRKSQKTLNSNARLQGESVGEHGWWRGLIKESLQSEKKPIGISLESTILGAIQNSHQIRVFSELPLIRETAIIEADATFDWNAYHDTYWYDNSDPVGSTLTVGADQERFNDHQLSLNTGFRRKTRSGGQLEIGQRTGWQQNNSVFFVPNPQSTSRLTLNYSHPLLKGGGNAYNQSLVLLAEIDRNISDDEFSRQLQSHLLEVTRAYWSTYLERGLYLQQLSSFNRAEKIADILRKRSKIDATQNQITSANAALEQRRANLLRAKMATQNADAKLRALVNDPTLGTSLENELIPTDAPVLSQSQVSIPESMRIAFQIRPEVTQALKQINAAAIRINMAKNELLPMLNLVTETYIAGLSENRELVRSWTRQFDTGSPGYSIGVAYEIPIGNRAANARLTRRQLEFRQLQSQYMTTIETVRFEVEVAVREVKTSEGELKAKKAAMEARAKQLKALMIRWEKLPGENVTATLALENLLLAQERLQVAESEYLRSQLTYNLSFMNLKRATGTLLSRENITVGRSFDGKLPVLRPVKDVSKTGSNPIDSNSTDSASNVSANK